MKNQSEDAKHRRAEREDPEEAEGGYAKRSARSLIAGSPPTIASTKGKPDILIDDLLALELKYDPSKAEMDRCVGQCMSYSREWVTWILLIDSPASKVGRLERLLADKGLERTLVWRFP